MSRIELARDSFLIDGNPVTILSGAIHYFRVPDALWKDRIEKAALCGLNCIETYMCWNLHEPEEGTFDFSGMLDFERFIRTAQEAGLYVIVRPGPYICAEWDNGGFPYWLMLKEGIEFRRMNKVYLDCVRRYYDVIMPKLAALQYGNGGPIIAMQVENEYGSYSHDREYLAALRQMSLDHGIDVPLFTADGASEICVRHGMLEGSPVFTTCGSALDAAARLSRKYRPGQPPFCVEFWCGWFDHWGSARRVVRSKEEVAEETDDMLAAGGNLNYYMFHGGTNFGFYAGANGLPGGEYMPDTTSYDYDAPLSEAGEPTEKYYAIREVIRKYRPDTPSAMPRTSPKKAYGRLYFTECARLFDNLSAVASVEKKSLSPLTMEKMGQAFGYIHYRTHLDGPFTDAALTLYGVHDRAQVFLDGRLIFTYYRNDKKNYAVIPNIPDGGAQLDLLVENLGRINYGQSLGYDFKGITQAVCLSGPAQLGWENRSLPMDNLSGLAWKPFEGNLLNQPAFYRADLVIEDDVPADTFAVFPGTHGCVFINGHNIGRYWRTGAEAKTLYVPGCWLRKGHNEVIVFETENLFRGCSFIKFTDRHILN